MERYYFETVEKVLQNYPEEWTRNYFLNKQDVIIEYKDKIIDSLEGAYDNDENIITLYSINALIHELFHMAFRDRTKINKKFIPENIYYDNGVSCKIVENGKSMPINKGMTEGFVEYLTRKCCDFKGQSFSYFFVDLLISIYGEEILKYPFLNDIEGLLIDKSFFDIMKFFTEINKLKKYTEVIIIVSNCKEVFVEFLKSDNTETQKEVFKDIEATKIGYQKSIISLFEIVINEYKNCDKPNISKNEFIEKLQQFLIDSEYEAAFGFDNDEYSVKENLITIINDFKNDKTLIKK